MKILGETIHLKENLQFSLKSYPSRWIILIVTMIFDILTTFVFVTKYGINTEENLSTRLLMLHFGTHFGNIFGKFLQLISVAFFVSLNRKLGNIFLLFIILANCLAIVINSISVS